MENNDSSGSREIPLIVLITKANKMDYFSNLFWYITLHVSESFPVHHQES
jgi:hypothetical protein